VATPRKTAQIENAGGAAAPPGTHRSGDRNVGFYVARALSALDLKPVVIDAHEVRVKARRPAQKSDRCDAFELCDGLRLISIARSFTFRVQPSSASVVCPRPKPAHKEYRV